MTGVLPGLEGYAGRDLALGQWDTDPTLARAFVRWCGVGRGDAVIEPSCGIGNVALAAMVQGAEVIGVELDPVRAALARSRGVVVVGGDVFGPALDEARAQLIENGMLAAMVRGELRGVVPAVAIGNPPFEAGGAVLHPLRWLDAVERVCWIAPLETLAGASRIEAWESMALVRVDVCRSAVGSRPPFGEGGHGMSEIAFFEAVRPVMGAPSRASLGWVDWRALGAPGAGVRHG